MEKNKTNIDLNTLNSLPLPVIIYNENQILFLNNEAKKFFKLKSLNKKINILHFFPKERHTQVKTAIKKILSKNNYPTIEMPILDSKGNEYFIEAKSNKILFQGKSAIQSTFIEINKRVSQIKQLKKTSDILSNLGKNSDEVIFELSFFPKPAITYISDSVKRILGKTPEQVYKNIDIFLKSIHPDDVHQYTNSLNDYVKKHTANKTGKAFYRFYKTKKQIVYLQAHSQPIFNKQKQLIGIIGTLKDVTENHTTQELLKEAKQKFDLITNNGNDVIAFYTYYPKEKYTYVSPNITKLNGFTTKDVLKDHLFFSKRSKETKPIFDKMDALLKRNQKQNIIKDQTYVYKSTHKNGKEIWLENKLTPILNDNGKIAFYLNLYRDITLQKQKEIELEYQKNNFEQLLEKSPAAYLIYHKGIIVYCNNALIKILKAKNKTEIIGKSIFDFLDSSSIPSAQKRIKELYENKVKSYPSQYLIKDTKGKIIEAEIISYLQKYNNQECILSMVSNLTKEKEIQRETLKLELSQQANKLLEKQIIEKTKIQNQLTEKSKLLSSILENSDHLIWTVDKDYRLTSFNANFYKLVTKLFNVKFKVGDILSKILPGTRASKDYLDYWDNVYDKAFKGQKQTFITKEQNPNNQTIYIKLFINPIYDEQNNVVSLSCIANDVTQEKSYEQKLVNQTARLSAIFESGNQSMWTINSNRELTSVNENYLLAMQDIHGKKPVVGLRATDPKVGISYQNDTHKNLWLTNYNIAFSGIPAEFVSETINQKGTLTVRQIYLTPIIDSNKNVIEVSGVAYDITDKRTSNQKIIDQAAKLNSIIDSSHHYIWTIDNRQRLTSFNKNYFHLIESIYNTKPFVGLKLNRGILKTDKEYNDTLKEQYQKSFNGNATHFEIETQDVNENKIYLEVFLNPILNKDTNIITEVSGIAHDITEKKLSQQKVEQSLKEKEVLLKEIHHRVKNNMQVVSSILNLQSSYLNDPYALSVLKESQNRIKTMSYIHESLYQNKTFTSVNFSEYLQTLTNNIIQSYSISESKIKLILDIEKITLSLDNTIPTGLIVNELLSNAIKHAFPGENTGAITVNLKQELNNINLSIKDNGAGFDDYIDFYNSPSLGLQLVNTLIEQINGTINFSSKKNEGTNVFITFKV